MLRCAGGAYYVGCTTALEQRLAQHHDGTFDGWTSTRRPLALVWSEEFQRLEDAIAMERRLKRWSRAKKEAVIRGEWQSLPALASRSAAAVEARGSRRAAARRSSP